ncbi:MAG: methyltransferase domain-containing protein [Candidatus Eremiobacteraeota bacterium]|nr:methyltransferase domain-containing protein [Candidatus Eremiobacteraeota bacterium]
MNRPYVHGYDPREALRLADQATTLVDLLHHDTAYPTGHRILEVGCGIGAQTITLSRNSPEARFTSIDFSEPSLAAARRAVEAANLQNVELLQADIFDLPFAPESFDHVFSCFVLEHLPHPAEALRLLKRVLKPGGSITAIEGDHGSAYFFPDSIFGRRTIAALVELQARTGGNALVGRALYPLFRSAGFKDVRVSPRMVYVDSSKPDLVEGFTNKTFTAMVKGVRQSVLAAGLMNARDFERGIRDLYRTADADGVFCYTFFKALATSQ